MEAKKMATTTATENYFKRLSSPKSLPAGFLEDRYGIQCYLYGALTLLCVCVCVCADVLSTGRIGYHLKIIQRRQVLVMHINLQPLSYLPL